MRTVTCVLLTRQERDTLVRCRSFIGIGAPSDEERTERWRRWSGLLQRHEVLTYEQFERAQIIAHQALGTARLEADPDHWRQLAKRQLTEAGHRMVEVIVESRIWMAVDLAMAIDVLDQAVATATPRLFGDDLEEAEEDGEDFS